MPAPRTAPVSSATLALLLAMLLWSSSFIAMKVALAATLREQRMAKHLSQVAAANYLQSSQSRVAKMEQADKTVTVDLLIRSILKLGGTREMLAAALCH